DRFWTGTSGPTAAVQLLSAEHFRATHADCDVPGNRFSVPPILRTEGAVHDRTRRLNRFRNRVHAGLSGLVFGIAGHRNADLRAFGHGIRFPSAETVAGIRLRTDAERAATAADDAA